MSKKEHINKLQDKLNKVVNRENLLNEEIMELSQELDSEITDFYKQEKEEIKKDTCQFKLSQ